MRFPKRGDHRLFAPLAVQAELGRGCNQMMLETLQAGPEDLAERLGMVSERMLDCVQCASEAGRGLVGQLSRTMITPVDGEDLVQLSRHLTLAVELLARVSSTSAFAAIAEPALHPIHGAIGEFFELSAGALRHLGERDAAHSAYVELDHCLRKAKDYSRQHFTHLLATAENPRRALAVMSIRQEYVGLVNHLVHTARLVYRIALKNGA